MPATEKKYETTTIIQPKTGWSSIDFRELWDFRELLGFLVVRDIKVKYKQTFIGIAWAVLQPLVTMVIFTIFFGRLAKMPSEGLPYEVFSFIALIPWTYFATALTFSSTSLVTNQHILSKIYFPRLMLPAGAVLAALADLLISLVFLFAMLMVYGIFPTPRALWLAPFTLLALITALGCGLWLSAINVKYRDIQYAVPFGIQIWMFVTPVVYPSSLIPDGFKWLYGLNPMVAVIEGYRWALVDKPFPPIGMMTISVMVSLALFVGGLYYFRRMEKDFADVV